MRCDLSGDPLERNYLLDGDFILSQEELGSEQFKISGIPIVMELLLLGFEVKWLVYLGFTLELLLMVYI